MPSSTSRPETIVLIHGLWMTALSWEHWVDRYERAGHRVIARSWPGMEVDVEDLRRDPSAIDHLGIEEIVDHYDAIIRALDEPPIIMGHSFGGAFTEICLIVGLAPRASPSTPRPSREYSRFPSRSSGRGFQSSRTLPTMVARSP